MSDPRRFRYSRRMRSAIVTLMSLATGLIGCASGPGDAGEPSVQQVLADSLVLVPGEEVQVQQLRVTFLGVSDDSRCPIDAMCVWQGNAAVRITLSVGTDSRTFTANTAYGSDPVEHAGYRVTLLSLAPIPRAGIPVPAGEYRAAIQVEALTGGSP